MVIIGDLHGAIKSLAHKIDRGGLTNQNLIQVGDFGLGFYGISNDNANLAVLNSILQLHNSKLYVIRGNHDDPHYWSSDYTQEYSNIKLVRDYDILEIEDKQVLFAGGGISIDRSQRVQGSTYWKDEVITLPSRSKVEEIKDRKPSIVITHTAPHFVYPTEFNNMVREFIDFEKALGYLAKGKDLEGELVAERRALTEEVYDVLLPPPTHWYYGHFHANRVTKVGITEFRCVGISNYWDTNKQDYVGDSLDISELR